jgi:glycine dehydrogenase
LKDLLFRKIKHFMHNEEFLQRHIGPRKHEIESMVKTIGVGSLDELINRVVPDNIRLQKPLELPEGITEYDYLNKLKSIAQKNKVFRTYIGLGYYNTIFPSVIKRNILENPSWYTSYTPYQAEISQGRLEALLNFQTVITELTALPIANASLLDEATAAAEAMIMFFNARNREQIKNNVNTFIADCNLFPQTIDVLKTRSAPLGINLVVCDVLNLSLPADAYGILVQYPNINGEISDFSALSNICKEGNIKLAVAADLLSLTLLTPPGEWGADVVLGSSQRLGIPMGFGGPHAAFFATKEEFKRSIPGRIIGISIDAQGKRALRMALQTREQHIKRERATSNICTAQALLATMAGMYVVYHGADGLKEIALRIHQLAVGLVKQAKQLGYTQKNKNYFDTIILEVPSHCSLDVIQETAIQKEINFRYIQPHQIGISLDETTSITDVQDILQILAEAAGKPVPVSVKRGTEWAMDVKFRRTSTYLKQEVFNKYHSETEMMRYIKKLERRDISLTHSMISLGSCTMKLNAATEMFPLSWSEFGDIHPFVPPVQALGYAQLFQELEDYLKVITGFQAVSFQPNSGAAGEYAGLLIIREYHIQHNQPQRNVVLIPSSAHGTNPASAAMAGLKIQVVDCDDKGNIKVDRLKELAEQYKEILAGFMVTYPSTHGVFEGSIREMAEIIHQNGGLVYMDGANMNAQVGLTNPATIGADVCHLNLHKTFAIPHGGGGPGVGPIAVNEKLAKYLPAHPLSKTGGMAGISAVAAAPYGSASVLVISHAYCTMLGGYGLTQATKIAILNANYLAKKIKDYFPVLYTGATNFVAHEMIFDCRPIKALSEISEADIAKRLMDYGFHAPTLSFPVHGTLMVEPTESESLQELDRFVESLLSIYKEIQLIISGESNKLDNPLKNAPHTQDVVISDQWEHPYSREKAAFPLNWIRSNKFWPSVSRIDDAFGDRNLQCSCEPIENYGT